MNHHLNKGCAIGLLLMPGLLCTSHASAQNSHPVKFKVEHVTPNGPNRAPNYYEVLADFGDDVAIPVLEVRTHTAQMSAEKRALEFVKRLTILQSSNPAWFKDLKTARYVNGEMIVAPASVPAAMKATPYIATADQPSVTPMGCRDRQELANKLKVMLTNAFKTAADLTATRGEKIQGMTTPQSLMWEGDRLKASDPVHAKLKYQEALKLDPNYVYVQVQLARIYLDEGETRLARQILQNAQKQKDLSADDQAMIAGLKADLQAGSN